MQGLVERARGTSGVLRERGRAVMAALDAAADVDVVSTLEAEAAHLAAEIAAAADETAADPVQAELEAEAGVLDAEEAALRERWADVLGDDLPEDALAKVRARTEPLARAVAREQQDMTALDARLATLEQRHAAAAVKADLLDNESAALDDDHGPAGGGRRDGPAGAGRGDRAGGGGAAERPTRATRPGTAARPGPRRSSGPCATCRGPEAASSCAGWTAWWARCSTWSRSTRAGRRHSRRPPGAGRGRRSGRRAPVGPPGPGHAARAGGDRRRAGTPDDGSNGGQGATAAGAMARPSRQPRPSTCRRARAPSPCAATCGPVTGRPWPSPCSMR